MGWLQRGSLLHVGCGCERIQGWINIDLLQLPSVDVVADASKTLPFRGAKAIFAEHFLEHLRIDDALQFLVNAHQALARGAWMRLSTPNVEWTLATHYPSWSDSSKKITDVLMLNKGFRGWGHQFLWNGPALERALGATGFDLIRRCKYGVSALPHFHGIERHEASMDTDDLPHVLIFEARKGAQSLEALAEFRELVWEEFLRHLDPFVPRPTFGGLLPP